MRSLFAGGAFLWFLVQAIWFVPEAGVWVNDGSDGGLDGDPAALAIMWGTRTLCAGLALVSLALVDWDKLPGLVRDLRGKPTTPDASAG